MKRFTLLLALLLIVALSAQATVSTYSKDGPYTGDGTALQTFTITFEFFDTDEIVVTQRLTSTGVPTTLAETTHYTVSGTGGPDPYTGGTVTLAVGYTIAATSKVTLSRSLPQTQTTDLVTDDDPLEDRYDKITMMIQELQEQLDRSLKIPITDGATAEASCNLANAVERASSYLITDSDGNWTIASAALADTATTTAFTESLLVTANTAAFQTAMSFSSDVQSLLDDADLAAMQVTLGISSITVLDENDMGAGTGSAVSPPSQDSVYTWGTATFLPLAGGTMAANIVMGSNKITGLADGTASGDALHFAQVDDSSIEMDGSDDISIKDAGVTNAMLADGAALVPSAGADTTPYGTKVLDGSSNPMGTSYANLDLSSTIGAQKTLVFLKVVNNVGSARAGHFRANGTTEEMGTTTIADTNSVASWRCGPSKAAYVIVPTDASGIVEYMSGSSNADIDVFLMAYIR